MKFGVIAKFKMEEVRKFISSPKTREKNDRDINQSSGHIK